MIEDILGHNDKVLNHLANRLSENEGYKVTKEDVLTAIFILEGDKQDMDWVADVWDLELNEEEWFEKLKDFDFNAVEIEINIESIKGMTMMERKYTVKIKNAKWRIHKNDADPFPSNPHAHNISNSLKCDLSNGACYRKKKRVGYIDSKELLQLRDAASKAGFTLPPLKK